MDTEEYRDHPVRSYVLTSGRAHPSRNTLRPETLLRAVESRPRALDGAGGHERELLETVPRHARARRGGRVPAAYRRASWRSWSPTWSTRGT